ncbi:MAG: hypothetical protein A2233_04230 [Candidatus Kerfeldbacteria bacterium RIFOXYA2_FULL_38_24]|uniref:Uncharacterized protein n=1 Tax=Candidatus Kerfeldbacteria bacterium RIFOXYB2_FULL_38_14 TaxID=1798547 RepID=A0A1G2BFF0_9BACT|nr:MAG: hypothetical protein A2233_04230 [Candidatus Kerfeldbacteria bacterium RIFOXYA2_FULL_38_24]OGY86927.1 MAG: hypothetical protein A2319_00075 [Candidatus Kerfeldbacteria bacterium RIFOXYB2_FULL_38_14]OGY89932.1 MAG: hypothetical protein A2458_05080 [Candidatus Kerfeldbacteria bacterium RIFOXYC2_FULL_38_9]
MKKTRLKILKIIGLILIIFVLIFGLLIAYTFHVAKQSCYNSLIFYDIPKELYVDPYYKEYFPQRQFIKYTNYCNKSDQLSINELILFTDKIGNTIPARILEKQGDNYRVLTLEGEKIIPHNSIIAED